MGRIKTIGQRISISEQKNATTIVIDSTITKAQQISLEMWFSGWTGLGCLLGYGSLTFSGDERIFYIGSLIFWGFFWIRIAKVVAWRRIGKELIVINKSGVMIKNAFGEKGREKVFMISKMGEVTFEKNDTSSFLQQLDKSYWIIGGDTLHFSYEGKTHVFGKQLENHDSAQLTNVVNKTIKKYANKS